MTSLDHPASAQTTLVRLPQIAITATALAVVLLISLHVLKPDYNPTWRFISEYEIGDYGWVMQLSFLGMAAASVLVGASLWQPAHGILGKIGVVLHGIVGLAFAGAALFVADPMTADPAQMTSHGMLHGLFGAVAIPGVPLAALAVTFGMTSRGSSDRAALSLPAWLSLLLVVAMFGHMIIMLSGGAKMGPTIYAGGIGRIVIAAYAWWWIAAAYYAQRLNSGTSAAYAANR